MADHVSVMANEVVTWLRPERGGCFLDGTVGLGGHARALLEKGGDRIKLLGMDRDQSALNLAREHLQGLKGLTGLVQDTFDRFPAALQSYGWDGLDGALLDLGVSSLQLDEPDRGFSFIHDGPLDMRMDRSGETPSAWDLVNQGSADQLKTILYEFGEEPMASRIVRAIVDAREIASIDTTLALAKVVEGAYPAARRAQSRNHPATKTFQALRMAVNEELVSLQSFLKLVFDFIKPGGRVAIISFHSLEDRLVKHAFKREAAGCLCPPRQIPCRCGHVPRMSILTKKPVVPTVQEQRENSRSRSAKLRVSEALVLEGA